MPRYFRTYKYEDSTTNNVYVSSAQSTIPTAFKKDSGLVHIASFELSDDGRTIKPCKEPERLFIAVAGLFTDGPNSPSKWFFKSRSAKYYELIDGNYIHLTEYQLDDLRAQYGD